MKPVRNTLKKKADTLLQQLVRKLFDKCEVCGNPCQVGHHIVEKSRSNMLRYDMENIAHLCNICHGKVHNVFGNSVLGSYHPLKVLIKNRGGDKWLEKLERKGREFTKVDVLWYNNHIERLKDEIEKCS